MNLPLVPMAVPVRMGMKLAGGVGVTVGVDQIRAPEQGVVVQYLRRRAGGDNLAALEDMTAVSNVFDQVEIMSGGDHRLASAAATHQEIDHLAFTLGIERGGGLVEQQDFGVKDQHRSQSNSLFLSGRQVMRRAILQVRDLHLLERCRDAAEDLILGPSHLQRSEGYFIKHAGIEQLDIGILENQGHPAAEFEFGLAALQPIFGQGFSAEPNAAFLREVQSVEDAEQRRLT